MEPPAVPPREAGAFSAYTWSCVRWPERQSIEWRLTWQRACQLAGEAAGDPAVRAMWIRGIRCDGDLGPVLWWAGEDPGA